MWCYVYIHIYVYISNWCQTINTFSYCFFLCFFFFYCFPLTFFAHIPKAWGLSAVLYFWVSQRLGFLNSPGLNLNSELIFRANAVTMLINEVNWDKMACTHIQIFLAFQSSVAVCKLPLGNSVMECSNLWARPGNCLRLCFYGPYECVNPNKLVFLVVPS